LDLTPIFGPEVTTYIVIPLLIIIARIFDVSIGTLRLIFLSKGVRLAPLLGFVESLIWLLAIGQILSNMTNWVNYVAFAAGFALGNYFGLVIENRLALGKVILRIITTAEGTILLDALRETKYGITSMDAEGKFGDVKIIFMVLSRKDLDNVIPLVKQHNPKAFYSIEDLRYVHDSMISGPRSTSKMSNILAFKWLSKRK